MRPSFHPRLVNGPFDDPGMFVPFIFEKHALLFDPGELNALSPREILRVDHVLVSHTHMDHFIGFDHVLRLFLGRDKHLHLYGPAGILKNVVGKLSGYSWNLVESYSHPFVLTVHEVNDDRVIRGTFHCSDRFQTSDPPNRSRRSGPLIRESGYRVETEILDHGIPCLGFRLEEKFHVNILKEGLAEMELGTGPWLSRFKKALLDGRPGDTLIEIPAPFSGTVAKRVALAELAERITLISPGQKTAYITDAVFSAENARKIIALADQADQLFIEAAFLDQDREMARNKYHLTAWQAGALAAAARVKNYTLFHFSPRYHPDAEPLHREARQAFETILRHPAPELDAMEARPR